MKIAIRIVSAVIVVLSLSGHAQAQDYRRIVSLAPSITEILFELGLGDRIVGVTTFCDHPEEARKKPKAGGMSNPSLETVVSLRPDIVVMTTDGNPKEFEARVRALGITTYVFTARRISELPQAIKEMGTALGVSERAEEAARNFDRALDELSAGRRNVKSGRYPLHARNVLFIVWPEPLIVAGPGTAIDDAFTLLGMHNVASASRLPYPQYSIEAVLRQEPEVIFIGKGMGNMQEVSSGLIRKLAIVPAVTKGNVCYVGDSLYRLGPRVIQGIGELMKCLRQE